jgi:hypothetical protein
MNAGISVTDTKLARRYNAMIKTIAQNYGVLLTVVALAFLLSGCGSTGTSQGASTGAVVGGLVDGWEGAAVGAIIGGGIGYASDASAARKKDQEIREQELAALKGSTVTSDPKTAYQPENSNLLTGSTWRVISLVEDEKTLGEFSAMVISFQTNTKSTTLIQWADGTTETYAETYSVVADALVLTGKDYVTNAKFSIQEKQMILVAPNMRVVLEEVEENI